MMQVNQSSGMMNDAEQYQEIIEFINSLESRLTNLPKRKNKTINKAKEIFYKRCYEIKKYISEYETV
jgi:hypothetical protein